MLTTRVKVVVRVRPLTAREILEGSELCVDVTCVRSLSLAQKGAQRLSSNSLKRKFVFDRVFNMETKQSSVYSSCVKSVVEKFLSGYNGTIFAYGQTGSGKTYTMGMDMKTLKDDVVGIIPNALSHIMEHLYSLDQSRYEVYCSYMELYNDELVDLLDAQSKPSNLRDNGTGKLCMNSITKMRAFSMSDFLEILTKGSIRRATASTSMNNSSSRSHAVFILNLVQHTANSESEDIISTLNFVDLAGSERLKRTNAIGNRKKEGISINKGLLALGNVIFALAEGKKHVPYRDSKLTRILQDSLGGNSETLMVACVSPSSENFFETLNTLNYASRALKINNKISINTRNNENSEEISRLKTEIQSLRAVISQLSLARSEPCVESDESLKSSQVEIAALKFSLYRQKQYILKLIKENSEAFAVMQGNELKLSNGEQLSKGENFPNAGFTQEKLASVHATADILRTKLHLANTMIFWYEGRLGKLSSLLGSKMETFLDAELKDVPDIQLNFPAKNDLTFLPNNNLKFPANNNSDLLDITLDREKLDFPDINVQELEEIDKIFKWKGNNFPRKDLCDLISRLESMIQQNESLQKQVNLAKVEMDTMAFSFNQKIEVLYAQLSEAQCERDEAISRIQLKDQRELKSLSLKNKKLLEEHQSLKSRLAYATRPKRERASDAKFKSLKLEHERLSRDLEKLYNEKSKISKDIRNLKKKRAIFTEPDTPAPVIKEKKEKLMNSLFELVKLKRRQKLLKKIRALRDKVFVKRRELLLEREKISRGNRNCSQYDIDDLVGSAQKELMECEERMKFLSDPMRTLESKWKEIVAYIRVLSASEARAVCEQISVDFVRALYDFQKNSKSEEVFEDLGCEASKRIANISLRLRSALSQQFTNPAKNLPLASERASESRASESRVSESRMSESRVSESGLGVFTFNEVANSVSHPEQDNLMQIDFSSNLSDHPVTPVKNCPLILQRTPVYSQNVSRSEGNSCAP